MESAFDMDKPLDVTQTLKKWSSDDERVRLDAARPLVKG